MIAKTEMNVTIKGFKYPAASMEISFAYGIHNSGAIRVITCTLLETGEDVFNILNREQQREIRMACHAKLQEEMKK